MDRMLVFLVIAALAVSAAFAYTLFTSLGSKLTSDWCTDGGGNWDASMGLCQCGTRANLTCPDGYSCAYTDPRSESPPGYCVPIPPEFTAEKSPQGLLPKEWRACTLDEDCMPLGCCHPGMCVSRSAFPGVDCSNIACTLECKPGTMDCGQGRCVCQDGLCAVDWLNPTD
jgi:hypothetical protein